ncbi:MAG: hypothetical protein KJZ68_14455, partial [Phycisphaerales bacterium]|nr:hypothetical protein [Phycisphaerales bacterium]
MPSPLNHLIAATRRRVVLNRAADFAARGAAIGAGASIIALLVERLSGAVWPWAVHAGVIGVGAVAGAIWGAFTAPSKARVAVLVDERLGLADRVGTAKAIEAGHVRESDFALLAMQDAERAAHQADPRRAEPLRLPVAARWAGAGALAVAAGVLLLPPVDWSRSAEAALTPEEAAAFEQERLAASRQVEEALASLDQPGEASPVPGEQADVLRQLAEQMKRDGQKPDDFARARDDAARRMDEIARRMEREAARERLASEELSRRFAEAAARDRERSSELTSVLREALRERDAARAREAMESLGGETDPAIREQAAHDLRRLAENLRDASARAAESDAARREALQRALQEQGVDAETARRLTNPEASGDEPRDEVGERADPAQPSPTTLPDEHELARRLREQGVDDEVASRLAREIAAERERAAAREQANHEAREAAEALDQLADETEQRDSSPPQGDASDRTRDQHEPSQRDPGSSNQPRQDQPPAQRDPSQPNQPVQPNQPRQGERQPNSRPGETGNPADPSKPPPQQDQSQ